MPNAAIILDSLERYSAQSGDPGPEIYRRLYALNPEFEALFSLDDSGIVRGSMLQQAFDCLIDLTGEGRIAATIIYAERNNHDAYGVPATHFMAFFETIRDTLRDGLGAGWSAETEAAWAALLARANRI